MFLLNNYDAEHSPNIFTHSFPILPNGTILNVCDVKTFSFPRVEYSAFYLPHIIMYLTYISFMYTHTDNICI